MRPGTNIRVTRGKVTGRTRRWDPIAGLSQSDFSLFATGRGSLDSMAYRQSGCTSPTGTARRCQRRDLDHQTLGLRGWFSRLVGGLARGVVQHAPSVTQHTAFFVWRRGARTRVGGCPSWGRAGERKTCWTKPRPRRPELWALDADCGADDAETGMF